MAQEPQKPKVDLHESSVHGQQTPASADDVATAEALDRLEAMTGGADEPAQYEDDEIERQAEVLEASTEEEIDALTVNLRQDDQDVRSPRYGTGLIGDELAAERLSGLTESGADLADKGVVSASPGRDDTSRVLRMHHPNTEVARAQDVVEGNLDEPRDEALGERKVDEGTAA